MSQNYEFIKTLLQILTTQLSLFTYGCVYPSHSLHTLFSINKYSGFHSDILSLWFYLIKKMLNSSYSFIFLRNSKISAITNSFFLLYETQQRYTFSFELIYNKIIDFTSKYRVFREDSTVLDEKIGITILLQFLLYVCDRFAFSERVSLF